jgi:hypothetical protein
MTLNSGWFGIAVVAAARRPASSEDERIFISELHSMA